MAFRSYAGIVLGLAVASCSEPKAPKDGESSHSADLQVGGQGDAARAPDTNDAYSFGLKTREHELWLHAGSEPRLYTVNSLDGRVLARALDEAGLERDYPELHHLVHNAVDTAEGSADYAGSSYSDDR